MEKSATVSPDSFRIVLETIAKSGLATTRMSVRTTLIGFYKKNVLLSKYKIKCKHNSFVDTVSP